MKNRIKLKKRITTTIDRAASEDMQCETATQELLVTSGLLEQVKYNQLLSKN